MRQTDVKKSLIDQLRQQGKETPYTLAIVEDYMLHYRAVQQLWKDVRKRGVKVTGYNAKGQELVARYGTDLYTMQVDIRKIQLSHPQLCVPSNYSYFRLKARKAYEKGGMRKLSQTVSTDLKRRQFIDGCKSVLRKGK